MNRITVQKGYVVKPNDSCFSLQFQEESSFSKCNDFRSRFNGIGRRPCVDETPNCLQEFAYSINPQTTYQMRNSKIKAFKELISIGYSLEGLPPLNEYCG